MASCVVWRTRVFCRSRQTLAEASLLLQLDSGRCKKWLACAYIAKEEVEDSERGLSLLISQFKMMRFVAFCSVGATALHPLNALATQTTWQAGDPMTVNVDYDVPSTGSAATAASFLARGDELRKDAVRVLLHLDNAHGRTSDVPVGEYSGGVLEYRMTEVDGSKSAFAQALAAEEQRHEKRERETASFLSSDWHRVAAPEVDVAFAGHEAASLSKRQAAELVNRLEEQDKGAEKMFVQSKGVRGRKQTAFPDVTQTLNFEDADALREHLRQAEAFDRLVAAELASASH